MIKLLPILIAVGIYIFTRKKDDAPVPTPTPVPKPSPGSTPTPNAGIDPNAGKNSGGGVFVPGSFNPGAAPAPVNHGLRMVHLNNATVTPPGISTANGDRFVIAEQNLGTYGISGDYVAKIIEESGTVISVNQRKIYIKPANTLLKYLLLEWAKENNTIVTGTYNW